MLERILADEYAGGTTGAAARVIDTLTPDSSIKSGN